MIEKLWMHGEEKRRKDGILRGQIAGQIMCSFLIEKHLKESATVNILKRHIVQELSMNLAIAFLMCLVK